MTAESQPPLAKPDPAAVFACATSLWRACHEYANHHKEFDLSDNYNGMDQLMREVMSIGNRFEQWACEHVNFNELDHVWPYLLEDRFGKACLDHLFPHALPQFNDRDCLRVALQLRLPIVLNDVLAIPVDLTATNPLSGTGFAKFRIQTVRISLSDSEVVPFVPDDDPFDENFGERYFALYGVGKDEMIEHIADRETYEDLLTLVQKLAPGIAFPTNPTFSLSQNFGK